jgi:hypothetical protein
MFVEIVNQLFCHTESMKLRSTKIWIELRFSATDLYIALTVKFQRVAVLIAFAETPSGCPHLTDNPHFS